MGRKTKCALRQELKSANTTARKPKLPPDPGGLNDLRAAEAKEAIKAFRNVCVVDKQDALGDLLTNLMHLCDRDPQLGNFDAALNWAYHSYKAETGTEAEYSRI